MTKKPKRTASSDVRNLAGRLYHIVDMLGQPDPGTAGNMAQRKLLQKILDVPDQPGQEVMFHTRLAQLHALPDLVRSALESQDAPEQFLAWYGPITTAIGSLQRRPERQAQRVPPESPLHRGPDHAEAVCSAAEGG